MDFDNSLPSHSYFYKTTDTHRSIEDEKFKSSPSPPPPPPVSHHDWEGTCFELIACFETFF